MQLHFKIKMAQRRNPDTTVPHMGSDTALRVSPRANSVRLLRPLSESARHVEHKFDLRGNGGWAPLVETHPHGKTYF